MTPERTAALVARWVRFYTRNLPAPIAERRVDEVDADLHDHIAHGRTHGSSDRRIALSILSRMVRGLAADAAWCIHHTKHTPVYRSTVGIVRATAFILLVPLVAMLFTDDVVWGPLDFVLAGALLLGTGLAYQVVARRAGTTSYRLGARVALAAALLLVWASLAVGIVGEDGDPFDLLYGGVLAVGILGAVIARFQPHGMARVLLAMALAQVLVAVIALIAGKHHAPISSVFEIVALNGFFAALFVASAWLFQNAARASSG